MNKTIQQCAAWLGCFVILLAAMAPSVSRVLVAYDNTVPSLFDICTMDGMVQFPDDSANRFSTPATDQVMHIEHCPFCLNNPVALGIIPTAPQHTSSTLIGYMLTPALFYQSHSPLYAWHAAQPRGPPALS